MGWKVYLRCKGKTLLCQQMFCFQRFVEWLSLFKIISILNPETGSFQNEVLLNRSLQTGTFCQFPFRWIYYYGSNKATGKETDKTHLCVHCSICKITTSYESLTLIFEINNFLLSPCMYSNNSQPIKHLSYFQCNMF